MKHFTSFVFSNNNLSLKSLKLPNMDKLKISIGLERKINLIIKRYVINQSVFFAGCRFHLLPETSSDWKLTLAIAIVGQLASELTRVEVISV